MGSPATPAQGDERPGPAPSPVAWGGASGVGSLPGTDPAEAMRLVVGELPDFAHLPELPARGPGADLIGRSAALLVDLAFDLTPAGWRLVPRPGIDQRRAQEFLAATSTPSTTSRRDGPARSRCRSPGPWTLAAGLERTRGDRAVVDAGARRDLAQSLAEGIAAHVAAVAARLPGAQVVVQLDEPSVPAVLQGGLPTVSGFGKLPAVEAHVVEQELAAVVAAPARSGGAALLRPAAPLDLFRAAGAGALSFDLGLVQDLDAVGTRRRGRRPPRCPASSPAPTRTCPRPRRRRPGCRPGGASSASPPSISPAAVTLTPSCGLAGATPGLRADGDGARARGGEVPPARMSLSRVRSGSVSYPADTVRP